MKKEQEQVREFMLKAGQECPTNPSIPTLTIANLRYSLIKEELEELQDSMLVLHDMGSIEQDMPNVADAIGDLLVVVLGTAVAYGIDIDPVFQEIHRSNMTKFIDGYRREDGKWIKGPSYSPANLAPIIKEQMK